MTEQRKIRKAELERMMDNYDLPREERSKAYEEWSDICYEEQCEYAKKAYPDLKAYYEKYIAGKTWEEVDGPTFDFYSDYFKDVFGYRPRQIGHFPPNPYAD